MLAKGLGECNVKAVTILSLFLPKGKDTSLKEGGEILLPVLGRRNPIKPLELLGKIAGVVVTDDAGNLLNLQIGVL